MSSPLESIFVGLASLSISGLSFIYANRAQAASRLAEATRAAAAVSAAQSSVDAAAYDRAKNLYESALRNMEHQAGEDREEISRLKQHTAAMEVRIAVLETALRAAGIPIPRDPLESP